MNVVVLDIFLGLVCLIIWTYAAQFSKFSLEALTCDINYGQVIATTQADSLIHCGIYCESWIGCRSGVFSVMTGTCFLNNRTKPSGVMILAGCGQEIQYIEKQAVIKPCDSNTDCMEQQSPLCENNGDTCRRCVQGKCMCRKSTQYNIFDNMCRSNCTNLDETFLLHSRSVKTIYSDKVMRSNVSITECKEACLCETRFTCIWFTYSRVSALCTYTDKSKSGAIVTGSFFERYGRICADP